MVDVRVGLSRSPRLTRWIRLEILDHILMHQLLQVEAERIACRSNDDIGADAGRARDIATGIADVRPRGIVAGCYATCARAASARPWPLLGAAFNRAALNKAAVKPKMKLRLRMASNSRHVKLIDRATVRGERQIHQFVSLHTRPIPEVLRLSRRTRTPFVLPPQLVPLEVQRDGLVV